MAISLNSHVVSDLCLGKPPLRSLSISASISDAVAALRTSDDSFVSIWTCDHRHLHRRSTVECRCVGKVCMGDVLCFLCKEENLDSPVSALQSPVSVLFPKISGSVKHVEPSTSLLEAISLIIQGAHHLVIPIQPTRNHQKPYSSKDGQEFCWLTQEDLIRFILCSIGSFTPIPSYSIEDLQIIKTQTLKVDYHSPASTITHLLSQSLITQTSLAVIDSFDNTLVGEISPSALSACDESAAAATLALSCGDLMAYIDNWGPPEDLIRVVKARLKEKSLEGFIPLFDDDCSSLAASFSSLSSSDDEDSVMSSPRGQLRRCNRSWSYSVRTVRRVQEITCHPGSSLVAVMIQAIAHRVNYAWVVEDDNTLVGIVTFSDMLKVFYELTIELPFFCEYDEGFHFSCFLSFCVNYGVANQRQKGYEFPCTLLTPQKCSFYLNDDYLCLIILMIWKATNSVI
ncbi:uncharacterized protein [Phyllobates terribilis]|uniref:uncharacterized protein n=1 Tax=Phyllobates terribilis TaxID=111132 RepID=UPI003CCACF36